MAKVGRPKIFKSVEEVEEKINAYFKYCEDKDKPYTMSGLAYYLDVDRRTIVNYTKEEEFFLKVVVLLSKIPKSIFLLFEGMRCKEISFET